MTHLPAHCPDLDEWSALQAAGHLGVPALTVRVAALTLRLEDGRELVLRAVVNEGEVLAALREAALSGTPCS